MTRLPNLIIAGLTHGATTSLFTYLSYHPDICGSTIKETHYFYPIISGDKLDPIDAYREYFKHCGEQKYIMEAGPAYIYGGIKLAQILKSELENIRLIFTLREPIDRLFSYFKYRNKVVQIGNLSFDEFVKVSEEKRLNDPGMSNRNNVKDIIAGAPGGGFDARYPTRGGFYASYLREWYEIFDEKSIKIIFFDDLKKNPLHVMEIICNWLHIDYQIYLKNDFTVENRGFSYKNKRIHKLGLFINEKFEPFFRKYPVIKKLVRKIYSLNITEISFVIDEKTRDYLEKLYKPHNKELYHLLQSKRYNHFPDWLKES